MSVNADAAERIPNSLERPVEVAWHYAKCLVDTAPGSARRVFAYTPFSHRGLDRLRKAQRSDCLGKIAGSVSLSMPEMLIRGGLAEHLLAKDFNGINGPARGEFAEIFASVPAATLARASEEEQSALLLLAFAQCVVTGDQQGVTALFATGPATKEEKAAIDVLGTELSGCLEKDSKLQFSREGLRAYLGEAAYRISVDSALKRGEESADA